MEASSRGQDEKAALLLVKQNREVTSSILGMGVRAATAMAQSIKRFLVLFCKKELLAW
jgi:hypothetical protein